MKGTWQTTGGGEPVAVLASLAVGAAMVWAVIAFATEILIVVAVAVVAVLAVLAVLIRRNLRATPPPFTPAPREIPPSRPAEAIQGPQQVHIHLHGVSPAQAAEELAAIREAGYRAWPAKTRRDQ